MHVGVILQGNVVDLWERLAQEEEMLVVRSPPSSCVCIVCVVAVCRVIIR